MCVIFFALDAHPRYSLIVAANRDESHGRPAVPAAFWPDHPHVHGGRDLRHGGTWLAIARDGRFAAVTNYRQGRRNGEAPRSRGALTRDYLVGTQEVGEYIEGLVATQSEYHGYSLILGTAERLYFCSNRGEGVYPISPGVHGLSNRLLDEPWPKVLRGVARITTLLDADEGELERSLFELLADRTPAPDDMLPSTGIEHDRERSLSPAFIAAEHYGTRASTVVLVGRDGNVLFWEKSFGPNGQPAGSTAHRFALTKTAGAAQPTRA
jgi:uncharacterized protein with NRDE domain